MKQYAPVKPIVVESRPVTLVGGGALGPDDLSMCLARAPRAVAADGGADRLLAADHAPAAVIGDFDSLSEAARAAYADRLHRVAEQDTTDFEKCLARIEAPLVLAAGFLGGRLDHTLSALSVIARRGARHVVLVAADQVALLLPEGGTRIAVRPDAPVALLPLGPARVSSRGLKWDLSDTALAPDGMVSSSNRATGETLDLRVAGPVLLTLAPRDLDAAIGCVLGR